MSVAVSYDVFCDRCSDWIHCITGPVGKPLAREALAIAKKSGWSRDTRSVYTDLCPKCLEEARREA